MKARTDAASEATIGDDRRYNIYGNVNDDDINMKTIRYQ